MADIEADGMVVSLDGGETYRFHDGSGSFSIADLAEQPTPYIARAAGPAFEGSTLAALTAPESLTKPTITAPDSTVGVTLGGANGTWKGNPLPTLSRIFWLKNSTEIPSQNGGTLSTATGFAVGDEIIRGTEIVSTINGQEVKVTEYSLPFTLTEQQSLMAPTPTTVTQGQQTIIAFNVLPDSVTVTQGGKVLPATRVGSTNNYMFVPLTNDPVSISALKAGYTPFNATWAVAQAAAALAVDPTFNVFRVDGLTGTNKAVPFTAPAAYAETEQLSTATAANGPQALDTIAPEVVGGGAADPGKLLRLDLKKWATQSPDSFRVDALEFRAGYVDANNLGTLLAATGRDYTVLEANRSAAIRGRYVLSDANGTTTGVTAPVSIPAAAAILQADAPTEVVADIAGLAFQSGETWTKLAGTGTINVTLNSAAIRFASNASTGLATYYIRGAGERGSNQYAQADWYRSTTTSGLYLILAAKVFSGTTVNRHFWRLNGNNIELTTQVGGTNTPHHVIDVSAYPTGTPTVLGLELINGTTLRGWVNGTMVHSVTLTGSLILTGGGIGLQGLSPTAASNRMTNFIARATK